MTTRGRVRSGPRSTVVDPDRWKVGDVRQGDSLSAVGPRALTVAPLHL